eukprot:2434804-Alexandrium_andersonii.AAC.1
MASVMPTWASPASSSFRMPPLQQPLRPRPKLTPDARGPAECPLQPLRPPPAEALARASDEPA